MPAMMGAGFLKRAARMKASSCVLSPISASATTPIETMEALLVSIGVVALAEMGDKTQLLAFILAARFKKPAPIIAGIFVATAFNHGIAGALGAWITTAVSPQIL